LRPYNVGIVAQDQPLEHKKTVTGLCANFILLIYYASPLGTVKEAGAVASPDCLLIVYQYTPNLTSLLRRRGCVLNLTVCS
jgi:hypothetical protein